MSLTVQEVAHHYGDLPVLHDVSFEVAEGSVTAIVGPTGCGKSTLLRIIAGLIVPARGRVTIGGAPAAVGRSGYMPQGDTLLPWRRALDNATLAGEVAGRGRDELRREAATLFERFGLAGFEHMWPSQLSGGMRQRVALLRTVLCTPAVVLLDEPFGALDQATRHDLHGWFLDLVEARRPAVVMVTHDVDEGLALADQLVVFSPRPATVCDRIDLPPRPRSPARLVQRCEGQDFAILKHRVLTALGLP